MIVSIALLLANGIQRHQHTLWQIENGMDEFIKNSVIVGRLKKVIKVCGN
nr:hypothetical protein [Bacillus sp. ISL-57]